MLGKKPKVTTKVTLYGPPIKNINNNWIDCCHRFDSWRKHRRFMWRRPTCCTETSPRQRKRRLLISRTSCRRTVISFPFRSSTVIQTETAQLDIRIFNILANRTSLSDEFIENPMFLKKIGGHYYLGTSCWDQKDTKQTARYKRSF